MARNYEHPFTLLLASIFVFLFFGCTDTTTDDPPPPDQASLTLGPAPPGFSPAGGRAEFTFSTNRAWELRAETQEHDDGSWIEFSPVSGDAGEEITVEVTVEANESYLSRTLTLVLTAERLKERIGVTQLKKNAIIVGDNRLELDAEAQTLRVGVQSNVTYEAIIEQGAEWLSEASESLAAPGLNEEEHLFAVAANRLAEQRTGVIVFRDKESDLSDEVTVVQAAWEDPDPERTALEAIYQSAGGSGWTNQKNWCSDKPLGEWYGVQTDSEGHVTDLRLSQNNLAGTILEPLGRLTKLKHLDLSRNELEEDISFDDPQGRTLSHLDDLSELETIDLAHNRFQSYIPSNWDDLMHLEYVNLSFNQLKDSFPSWDALFENGRTVELILNNNALYGDIPAALQNHPEWSRLALQCIRQDNEFGGALRYTQDIILPDFTFTDLRDGSQGSIRDVYGANKVTMVMAWDPTQEVSKTLMETTMRRFHTLFRGQGFGVVAITPEGAEYKQAAEQYLAAHEVPYPVVSEYADAQGRRIILPAYPYPGYLLLDQSGKMTLDMYTGQYCDTSLYPEEPIRIDFAARPFQHTNELNYLFRKIFGNSEYQSSDFTKDKTFETLQTATKGKGIDIVLIGEAFTDIDIETGFYKQVMEFAMESFFALEPTKSYREYFNVHLVNAVSRDAYIDDYSNRTDTALGITLENSREGFDTNTALRRLPDYYRLPVASGDYVYIPTVGVIINNIGGGVAHLKSAAMGPSYAFTGFPQGGRLRFREVFNHETVGHAFGWLGDEYFEPVEPHWGEIPESEKKKLRTAHNNGWFLNLSLSNDPKLVYWSHLIGHPRYPYVGILQGGYYYAQGVWRSEKYTLMEYPTDYYFNTICRELIVKRIMKLAGEEYTFAKFLARDNDTDRPFATSQQTTRQDARYRHQPPIMGD